MSTDRLTNRRAGSTSEIGVNATLEYYETGTGVMLTRYVEGAIMMTPKL